MTYDRVYMVDWRDEFAQVRRFLDHGGGVMRVVGDESTALEPFIARLRAELGARQAVHARFDGTIEDTRYEDGILSKIGEKLGYRQSGEISAKSSWLSGRTTTYVGNDIAAGGDVNINVEFNDGVPSRAPNLRELQDLLRNRLDSQLVVLLVTNEHEWPERVVRWLWRSLWPEVARPLCGMGLSLICTHAPGKKPFQGAPAPSVHIALPERFAGAAADHALDDMTEVFVAECLAESREQCRSKAESFLDGCDFAVLDVHSRLPATIERRSKRR